MIPHWLYKIIFLTGCVLSSLHSVYSTPIVQEMDYVKAINAHLRLKDFSSACTEAKEGLYSFPHSHIIWEAYIKALAKQGNEQEMISVWKSYTEVFPSQKENRILAESLAWGVIHKASSSSSPMIRLIATLSAFLSQDAQGIEIILRSLEDVNSAIRAAAVQLSAHLRDDDVKESIYRLFRNETVWNVRLEAIHCLGKMKQKKAQKELLAMLESSKTSAEEMATIIESLVNMYDSINRSEVLRLVKSNRAGLRLLACQMVVHFDRKEDADLMLPLLEDHHVDVRKGALWALGYLRIHSIQGKSLKIIAEKLLRDPNPLVALKAAWLITLNDPQKGLLIFQPFFRHSNREIRILAAAHLSACGPYALPLILEEFELSNEPYVRMNLALGMLGQRVNTPEACQALYEGLIKVNERWCWDEKNHVKALIPSKRRHADDWNETPAAVDQITRLEILNILAVLKFPHAQQAIKAFLLESTWGITAMASATLLTEGDESALELVENLMKDEDMQVRIQAALILALWGGGDAALDILYNAFPLVDREMKEHILEGIVRISSPKSIPFLLDRLQEPSQSLRVIAAAGILLCLNH